MLEIDGVTKTYDSFTLGPIDLRVDDEVVAVLGPSGCGKTTLLAAIAGIIRPAGGTVRLDGRNLTGRPPEERGTALVFQDGALFPHMTARENIAYAAVSAARVADLAGRLRIEDVLDQPAPTLSGGQRQRVALARALAAEPAALLLDEPLANLDEPIKRRLRGEMRGLLEDLGVPTVYVTHDQRGASALGDRVAVMDAGLFHQVDVPETVFGRPATPFVAGFTGAVNVFEADVVDGGGKRALQWGRCRLDLPPTGHSIGDRVHWCIRPEHVEAIDPAETADRGDTIAADVVDRTYEGGDYRLAVAIPGAPEPIELSIRTPRYEALELASRDTVHIRLPSASIHLMSADSG